MKIKGTIAIACVGILFLFIFHLNADEKNRKYDLEQKIPTSPGKKLFIDLETGGDISISGKSGNEVTVKARLNGRDQEDLKVDVRETSSGVEITSSFHGSRRNYHASVHLEIETPSRFDVDLKTMGGDVSINDLEGDISGQTMGGELNLKSLKGKISLTTMGGEITVADSELDGSVKTMGGDVLIRNVSGSMKGSTMGGDVRYENGAPGSVKGEVRIHSMGGDLNVKSAPEGATLDTMGGDIHVMSAARFVEAKTMGGDIDLDSVDGSVDATTMGGDIKVRVTGDPSKGKGDVHLTSMGGDIELTVPEGMSMNFDLEIAFSHRSFKKPEIISDFPLNISEEEEDDDERYGHERILRGTGKSGNGQHLIKIRTISGNIYLKKGN